MSLFRAPELIAFLDAIVALRVPDPAPQKWLQSRVLESARGRCWHCGEAAVRVAPLLSGLLGGERSEANWVAVCPACRIRFHDADPASAEWSEVGFSLSASQQEQRIEALSSAIQHKVPVAWRRSVSTCRELLEATRWPHPRVAIGVQVGPERTLFTNAAAGRSAAWAALAFAAKEHGARPVEKAPDVLWLSTDRWPELAQLFIDRNALLRRVRVPGLEDAAPQDQGDEVEAAPWEELFRGVQEVRRGRVVKPRSGFRAHGARTAAATASGAARMKWAG